ncbi:MAG: hypothetical protein ABEJ40_05260 [Haloarculaceae archaeon]
MNGWIFAGALFVVILGFEVVVLRYFVTGPTPFEQSFRSGDGSLRSNEAAATPAGASRADGEQPPVEEEQGVARCPDCGTYNSDLGTVRYCRNCLSTLH